MSGAGSVEAVLAAIREEAQAEVERLRGESDATIARLRQEDAAVPVVVADADARIRDARRQARERAAEDDWADRQTALGAREAWTAGVLAAAHARLLDQPAAARAADLRELAREAVGRLADTECELLVAVRDAPLADEAWRRALADATGKHVTVQASDAVEGGCIARTADGRIRFDNTYAARVRRFEPLWRRALAQLFERLAAAHV